MVSHDLTLGLSQLFIWRCRLEVLGSDLVCSNKSEVKLYNYHSSCWQYFLSGPGPVLCRYYWRGRDTTIRTCWELAWPPVWIFILHRNWWGKYLILGVTISDQVLAGGLHTCKIFIALCYFHLKLLMCDVSWCTLPCLINVYADLRFRFLREMSQCNAKIWPEGAATLKSFSFLEQQLVWFHQEIGNSE